MADYDSDSGNESVDREGGCWTLSGRTERKTGISAGLRSSTDFQPLETVLPLPVFI